MIANDAQLAIVKEQIQRLESGLKSLEATVRPKSEKQFQLFAEGWIDQIQDLRNEIAEYENRNTVKNTTPFRKASDSAIKT